MTLNTDLPITRYNLPAPLCFIEYEEEQYPLYRGEGYLSQRPHDEKEGHITLEAHARIWLELNDVARIMKLSPFRLRACLFLSGQNIWLRAAKNNHTIKILRSEPSEKKEFILLEGLLRLFHQTEYGKLSAFLNELTHWLSENGQLYGRISLPILEGYEILRYRIEGTLKEWVASHATVENERGQNDQDWVMNWIQLYSEGRAFFRHNAELSI